MQSVWQCFLALSLCFVKPAIAADGAVILVVDPAWDDVGSYYQRVPLLRQYKVIKVSTHTGQHFHFAPGHAPIYKSFSYSRGIPNPPLAALELCPQLKKLDVQVEAVMPTSDAAVHLTDLLADCVGVRGNPAHGPLAEARRNKLVMGNVVCKAGIRCLHQDVVSSWAEAHAYLLNMNPPLSHKNPVVFKILQGSGGEGTDQINSIAEAKTYFDQVHGSVNKYKEVNSLILIQEYLVGTEYAVDSVSRDGVHKVVDVMIEDFRPANGIFDQYFGFKIQNTSDPKIQKIIEYAHKVLDATGLQNGASNTEVKWLESEQQPCLVEVNARWAGMNWHDGFALEDACMGNNQIAAAFTAYLDEPGFRMMPTIPIMKHWGNAVATVNYEKGIVKAVPGLAAAKHYPSYYDSDMDCPSSNLVGKFLDLTNPDCIPVLIAFVSDDKSVVDADYDRSISLVYSRKFFDIDTGALRQSLTSISNNIAGYAPLAALGFGLLAFFVMSRFSQERAHASDHYIAVE